MNNIQQTIKESEKWEQSLQQITSDWVKKQPEISSYDSIEYPVEVFSKFLKEDRIKLIESIIEEVESKWKKLKSFEGKNWNKTFGYNEALQDIKQLLKDSIK